MMNETEKAAEAATPKKKAATRRKTAATKPPKKLAQALAVGGKKKARAKPARKPAKSVTMSELADRYVEHLEKIGKSDGTVFSYRQDIRVAVRHFGEGTKVSALTKKAVAEFNESDVVKKTKAGKSKATPTIEKTRRVLRLALLWAAEAKLIDTAPVEAKTRGRKPKAEAS